MNKKQTEQILKGMEYFLLNNELDFIGADIPLFKQGKGYIDFRIKR